MGMRKIVLLLASVFLAVLLASGAAVAVTPLGDTAEKIDADTTTAARGPDAALDRALKKLVAMPGGPPGIIAVVQRGQSREVHTFGVANLKNGRRMGVNDRMRIASTAKAFSGAVALSLVSKTDKLSLDDTIGERLSDLPEPPPKKWSDVTLKQLLNHTSGLPEYTGEAFRTAVEEGRLRHPDPPAKLLTYAYDQNHKKPLFDPGTQYHYSNTDNIAVGLMVEDATGDTYENQLKKRVYRPLGLGRTSLPVGAELQKSFIHGYDLSETPPEDGSKNIAAGWAWASGGIVSTPANLNAFIRGYVGGDLFDRQTRAEQREVFEDGSSEPRGPGKNSAGLGVFRYETACGTVWGHTGNIPGGYTQFMAASPNGRRSATVSINAQIAPPVGDPEAFAALRRAEKLAVCAALADKE
jgi:D-alanyl-D-alanine carboxypeptidase